MFKDFILVKPKMIEICPFNCDSDNTLTIHGFNSGIYIRLGGWFYFSLEFFWLFNENQLTDAGLEIESWIS